MIIEICRSYGVLAHEGYPVYTWSCPASDIYNRILVDVPQVCGVNCVGEPIIKIDGSNYLLSELLTNVGDSPAIIIPSAQTHTHYKKLKVVQREG